MANYRWADVASSESCNSFGRTAMMLLERPNRVVNNTRDLLAREPTKKLVHFMRLNTESYYQDKSRLSQHTGSKTKVAMDLKDNLKITPSEPGDACMQSLPHNFEDLESPLPDMSPVAGTGLHTKPSTPSFAGILSSNAGPLHHKPAEFSNTANGTQLRKCADATNTKGGAKPHKAPEAANMASGVKVHKPVEVAGSKLVDMPHDSEVSKRTMAHHNVCYDEDTKEPMNPPKRPTKMVLDEGTKKRIESLVLDKLNKRASPARCKDATARAYNRLKDIAIGKATRGYQNYIRQVPIEERGPDDPQTPNCKENISASLFAAFYSKWRKQLHKYD